MKRTALWVTAVVFLGMFLFATSSNAQGVLLSGFINTFSLTSAAQGLPKAAAKVGVLQAMLLSIPLAARTGKPRLFAMGLGIMAVMLALCGAAPSALLLTVCYFLVGFGFGCVDTSSSAVISDLHQGPRGAMLMGVLHAVYGVGGILAPLWMTPLLGGGATWRTVLWILAAACALCCAACFWVFNRAGGALAGHMAPQSALKWADLRAFAAQKGNLPLVVVMACYCAHQVSIYLWITRIIGETYPAHAALGAVALSLFWVGTVLSRLIVPALRIPAGHYLRAGMALTALTLLVGLSIGGAVALCVATALAGLFGGAVIPMTISDMTRRNPQRSMLGITALLLTTGLSAIVCAPLIGFVVGKTSLLAGAVVSALFAAGSALCACRLRQRG
ncbi:MAG: MFS transporter [Oscillospiraceae bacterium]|jgi:fucose permease|nr:MFS transporter [Oscillospiraceae bacterium]